MNERRSCFINLDSRTNFLHESHLCPLSRLAWINTTSLAPLEHCCLLVSHFFFMQVSFAMHGIVLLQSLGLGSYPRTSIVWHTRWEFNEKDYTNLGNEITPILWTKMRKQSFKLIFNYFKYKRFLLQNLNGKFPTFASGNYYWDRLHKGEILKCCAASFKSILLSHSDKKLGDIRIVSAPTTVFCLCKNCLPL